MPRPDAARRRPQVATAMRNLRSLFGMIAILGALVSEASAQRVTAENDSARGRITFRVDGAEVAVFNYGPAVDLPHLYPLLSPGGLPLTVQKTEPYPHHRSVWFADTVQLDGHRTASFYNALTSQIDPANPAASYRDRVRLVSFRTVARRVDETVFRVRLVWEMDLKTPVLDEERTMRLRALGDGEYLLDTTFVVTARYGDVRFLSDAAHYAWPYVRMHPRYSVDSGGRMTNSEGGVNQAGTHDREARWVDYSAAPEGSWEGLALFSHPSNEHPHRWLTRDYGTFGPRRSAARHGMPFTLKRGQRMTQRVAILVHRGDVEGGRVAERYKAYAEGRL